MRICGKKLGCTSLVSCAEIESTPWDRAASQGFVRTKLRYKAFSLCTAFHGKLAVTQAKTSWPTQDNPLSGRDRGPGHNITPGFYACPCRTDILEPIRATDEELSGDKNFLICGTPSSCTQLSLGNEVNTLGPAPEGLDPAASSSKHRIKPEKNQSVNGTFQLILFVFLY